MQTIQQRIDALPLFDRIELWLDLHDAAVLADLTTYYFVCALVGFVSGLAQGMCMVTTLVR